MSEQQHLFEERQQPRRAQGGLLFVLFALIAGVLAFAALQGGLGGNGYSDEQDEAYQLAQKVQDWRSRHPSPGNYAQAAIRLAYNDGSFSEWDTSKIEVGFDDPQGGNSTHSEQVIHDEILRALETDKGRR